MTREEYEKYIHSPDRVGYGLGGCQGLQRGYPDVTCKGCQAMLDDRRNRLNHKVTR